MKRLSLWALLVPVALSIHLLSPHATAQESADLDGLVINMSTDSQAPPGLQVTLHVFTPDGGVETNNTVTGPNGEFSFSNVSFDGEKRYSISTTYEGITYGVEPKSLQSSTMLAVFDTTNDLAALNIDSHILIIREVDPKERIVSAAEVVLISNADLRTFQPVLQPASAMNFLRFTVPPDTSGLQVQSDLRGGDIIDVGTGFGLTAPVPPGAHQVTFNYTFPYQGSESSFSPTFLQGAGIFRILVPEGLGEATGTGISEIQSTNHRRNHLSGVEQPKPESQGNSVHRIGQPAPTLPPGKVVQEHCGLPYSSHRNSLHLGSCVNRIHPIRAQAPRCPGPHSIPKRARPNIDS